MWRVLTLALAAAALDASPAATWGLARSAHFVVYSQSGSEAARSTLAQLEQVRAFLLQQTGLQAIGRPPIRVIEFASAREYEPYRLVPIADAYYVGTESQDYIVTARDAGFAAHEYAHAVLHANKTAAPPWLAEGMAELLATARFHEGGSSVGGDLPGRSQPLRRGTWLPLTELLNSEPEGDDRARAGLFYAESWALADMLALSREYAPRFRKLLASLAGGVSSAQALQQVYERPPEAILRDVRTRVEGRTQTPIPLPPVMPDAVSVQTADLSAFDTRALLAEVLMVSGQPDAAAARFRELAAEAPNHANVHAALGTIAFAKGNHSAAREEWRRAISLGVSDAALCYRYASLASNAGAPAADIRPALERAIVLRADFDDAHYQLGLLEKNESRWDEALVQFRAMKNVAAARAFPYWIAVTDVLIQLDRREEALDAARRASENAATPEERTYAADLAWMAGTDLAVQLTHDAQGRAKMVATRVPHRTQDWNPFVEPGDVVRRAEGALKEVECGTPTRILVETESGRLALTIPDPTHLEMRNAPEEFTCGAQNSARVSVLYAEQGPGGGILRGMEFR